MFKAQLTTILLTLLTVGFLGHKSYNYFFNKELPSVSISGITKDCYVQGDVICSIDGKHSYKIKSISLELDEKPLIIEFKIGKSSFNHPFPINTRTLCNGKHTICVNAISDTVKKQRAEFQTEFYVDNTPLQAKLLQNQSENKVFQGRTMHLQIQTNKTIKNMTVSVLSKTFECFPESKDSLIYESFIPIDCEEKPNEYVININCMDHVGNQITLEDKMQVIPFPFKKQILSRVDANKMKEEIEIGKSQQELEDDLKLLFENSMNEKLFTGSFYAPLDTIKITTEFGVVRTSHEKGKYAHKAIDLVATPKTMIWAPQDGIVVMKNRYAYSGNTVAIDHGFKILTLLFHLDEFANGLEVGQKIKKGAPVGTLGKTGYATGYHLHWEMRINNICIDPIQWTKSDF